MDGPPPVDADAKPANPEIHPETALDGKRGRSQGKAKTDLAESLTG